MYCDRPTIRNFGRRGIRDSRRADEHSRANAREMQSNRTHAEVRTTLECSPICVFALAVAISAELRISG
jgi:hypothetical protein